MRRERDLLFLMFLTGLLIVLRMFQCLPLSLFCTSVSVVKGCIHCHFFYLSPCFPLDSIVRNGDVIVLKKRMFIRLTTVA